MYVAVKLKCLPYLNDNVQISGTEQSLFMLFN